MYRHLLIFLVISIIGRTEVFAQNIDQVIDRLEQSGALDKAVQRSLDRIKANELAAQKAEQEKQLALRAAKAKNARKVSPATDYIFGNPNAIVTIIEYSDFECSYCKRFHETPKRVVAEMTTQVNLVWRNFPLPFHEPMASKDASAAICAGEQGSSDAFWRYADAVMKNTKSNGQGVPEEGRISGVSMLAKAQGLDVSKFNACLDADQTKKKIASDIEDGKNAGVVGTPGVILVNHQTGNMAVLAGAVPIETVRDEIKKLLTK